MVKKKTKIIIVGLIVFLFILIGYFGVTRNQVIVNTFYCTPTIVTEGDEISISYVIQNPTSSQITVFGILFADYDDDGNWAGMYLLDEESPLTPIVIEGNGAYSRTYQWIVQHEWVSPDNILRVGLEVQQAYESDVHAFFDITYEPPSPPPNYSINVYTNPNGCTVTLDGTITQVSTSNTVFTDVSAGSHTLETSKTDFITDTRTITVVGNTEMLVTLLPIDTPPNPPDGTPGFELLALVVAIGVSLLIFKARK